MGVTPQSFQGCWAGHKEAGHQAALLLWPVVSEPLHLTGGEFN